MLAVLETYLHLNNIKTKCSYNTDDLLVVGAGRGLLPFYLGDTTLSNNNDIFKNVVSVERDQELVDYTKKVISNTGINNIEAVCNDYQNLVHKQMIIQKLYLDNMM